MPEHRIHLRKAWQTVASGAGDRSGLARVDLPLAIGHTGGSLQLARRFQRPATHRASERLSLLLEHAPGLTVVTLNEKTLWTGRADATTRLDLEWPPGDDRRCMLTIEAEIEPGHALAWGHVAIVIRDARDGHALPPTE